jgi:hypothetical protein
MLPGSVSSRVSLSIPDTLGLGCSPLQEGPSGARWGLAAIDPATAAGSKELRRADLQPLLGWFLEPFRKRPEEFVSRPRMPKFPAQGDRRETTASLTAPR